MTTSSFYQTDFTADDPSQYKAAIDGNFSVLKRIAALFAPYGSTVPDMTVNVSAGAVYNTATLTEVAKQTSSTIVAPSSANAQRIDRIAVTKASGGMVVLPGTASTAPAAPVYTSSLIPVCQILLSTASTSINNSMITDERTLYVF